MRLVYALTACLLLSGCTGGRPAPEPTRTTAPSPAVPRLRPGTHVDLTAVVSRVYGPHAFVVADADLPPAGQLVVSDDPVTVLETDLITISGLAEQLDQAALRRYGILDAATAVVVIASTVQRYPAETPTA